MNKQTTNSESQSEQVLAKVIVLGLDVHAESIRVVRQIDGGMPQPAQKFSPARFLDWVRRQKAQAEVVWSCYEAGPFGYGLHRQLEALGVKNLVVCAPSWDELSTGVKTDAGDARAWCVRLALYAAGHRRIFGVVRVPSPPEEQARAQTRLREQLRRARQRLEAQGRCLLLAQGHRVKGRWWQGQAWEELQRQVPGGIAELLEPLRECILTAHQKTQHLTQTVQAAAAQAQPVGLGALSSEIIAREIGDWKRFTNRRQVASYTGLCPGEHSSGASRPAGPDHQARPSAPAPHPHRGGLAPDALPARLPRRGPLAHRARLPRCHQRRAQESRRGHCPATGRRPLAHGHRTGPTPGPRPGHRLNRKEKTNPTFNQTTLEQRCAPAPPAGSKALAPDPNFVDWARSVSRHSDAA